MKWIILITIPTMFSCIMLLSKNVIASLWFKIAVYYALSLYLKKLKVLFIWFKILTINIPMISFDKANKWWGTIALTYNRQISFQCFSQIKDLNRQTNIVVQFHSTWHNLAYRGYNFNLISAVTKNKKTPPNLETSHEAAEPQATAQQW